MQPQRALTIDEVRTLAPSVFATQPWEEVSDKYQFIPTIDIVKNLINDGWDVTKAGQQRTLLPSKKEFTKHILRFRRPVNAHSMTVGDIFPEIVLTNSHDRGAAYQMMAGLFRLACTNGFTVADATFSHISIRHQGQDTIPAVKSSVNDIINGLPCILSGVKEMQEIELTSDERLEMATVAMAMKYDDDTLKHTNLEPEMLLKKRRYVDEKPDLWTTFNVIQENLIKGGIAFKKELYTDDQNILHHARRGKTRAVVGINEDLRLNKDLWELATAMKELKAA